MKAFITTILLPAGACCIMEINAWRLMLPGGAYCLLPSAMLSAQWCPLPCVVWWGPVSGRDAKCPVVPAAQWCLVPGACCPLLSGARWWLLPTGVHQCPMSALPPAGGACWWQPVPGGCQCLLYPVPFGVHHQVLMVPGAPDVVPGKNACCPLVPTSA